MNKSLIQEVFEGLEEEEMVKPGTSLSLVGLTTGLAVAAPALLYAFTKARNTETVQKWKKHIADVKLLLPYLQPKGEGESKTTVRLLAGVLFGLGFGRACDLLSDFLYRNILNQMFASDREQRSFPWAPIVAHVLAQLAANITFSSRMTVAEKLRHHLGNIVTTAVYSKTMSLSAEFHENKDSATTWGTVESSGMTVSNFIDDVFFEILPYALDLILSISTFASFCGLRLATIMSLALLFQMLVMIKDSENGDAKSCERIRRKKNQLASDAFLNWFTAYSFGRLDFEKQRFAHTVRELTEAEDQRSRNRMIVRHAPEAVMSTGLVCLVPVRGI